MSNLTSKLGLTNHNSNYSYSILLTLILAVILNSGVLPAQSNLNKRDLAFSFFPPSNPKTTIVAYKTEELSFNTTANEYATCFYDNNLIVVSNRKVNAAKRSLFDQSEYKLLGFRKKTNTWEHPHLMPGIFIGKENHGGLTFSSDLKRVYYTKMSKNSNSFELYTSERSSKLNNFWRNPKKVITIDSLFSIENPWLNAKGNLLYFASNKPHGYGGYDIYVAHIYADGSLGKPKNLGPTINTAADENFPSMNAYGTQFYFASNKSGGYGGYDLYTCYTHQGDYSKPQNLGQSINTKSNEVGLIPTSESSGFFSSDKDALSQKVLNIYSYQTR